MKYAMMKTSIKTIPLLAELELRDGKMTCDRDK